MVEAWHVWAIVGLVLWIAEMFIPGFVLGVFGTACLLVAPLAGMHISLKMQLLAFGIATAAMSLTIRPLVLRHFFGRGTGGATNIDAVIGKSGLVTEAIDHEAGTGRVKLGGESWLAATPGGSRMEIGEKVTVRAVEGCRVIVEIAARTERGHHG